MLRSTKEIIGYRLDALDGTMGKVKDLLVDDVAWIVRYAVADTRTWLPGRKVLIAPTSLGEPRWADRSVPVHLATEEIKAGPDIAEDIPVSRQHEIMLTKAFGWEQWWNTAALTPVAIPPTPRPPRPEEIKDNGASWDPFLRSAKEIFGYSIEATDGSIGHVEDLITDTATWHVRFIVVDTRNWLPGRKVLVSPAWLKDVDWHARSVSMDLTRTQVKESPGYDPEAPINRELATRLYDYYGRPSAWESPHDGV